MTDLQTALFKIGGYLCGRTLLGKTQFRMPVEVAPERDNFLPGCGNLFGNFHQLSPLNTFLSKHHTALMNSTFYEFVSLKTGQRFHDQQGAGRKSYINPL
jgi:hypothetical protein